MKKTSLSSGVVLAALIAICLQPAAAGADPAFPLEVSENHRYLVDQDGVPFLMNGDTPWSLIAEVSLEDAELYLADRADKGVTAIIVNNPEPYYCTGCFNDSQNPVNFYGEIPFLEPGRLDTPNEEYFAHSDRVIDRAADFGILVMMAPLYIGSSRDGFWNNIQYDNTLEECRAYGEWYGGRYRSFANVVYLMGGDRNPDDTVREKLSAIAEGIKASDPGHLMTFHAASDSSSTDAWDGATTAWLDLNATYTYSYPAFHPVTWFVWEKSYMDYNLTPTRPIFLVETCYENMHLDWGEPGGTPLHMRRQAYHSVLSGSTGHFYGNAPVWSFGAEGADPVWTDNLDDPGAATLLPNLRRLFDSRPWHLLVPDQDHTVMTAGCGDGFDYAPAARAGDGSTIMAYLPSPRTVTIDMGRVSGSADADGWWYNPRDGGAQYIGLFPNSLTREFTPPDSEDWVLVIDDASRGFPEPGAAAALVQFGAAAYQVNENGTGATISVTRTGGTEEAAGVRVATADGTALSGSDYTAVSETLTWAGGDAAAKTFVVAIADDACVEGPETIRLELSEASGAALGSPSSATLVILDDEVFVSAIEAASGLAYLPAGIDVGDPYYIDRAFTIASIPAAYAGLTWIMTANDDKSAADDPFLRFEVGVETRVLVGYDGRIPSRPSWLASWTDTGADITDDQGVTFRLLESVFPAGRVELGGNGGPADANMYIVLLRPTPTPDCGPADGGEDGGVDVGEDTGENVESDEGDVDGGDPGPGGGGGGCGCELGSPWGL